MKVETITQLIIFIPLLGSLLVPLAGAISPKLRSCWSVLIGGITAFLPLTLITQALKGGEILWSQKLALGLDFVLIIDPCRSSCQLSPPLSAS